MSRIVLIIGPTASGKTKLSIEVAKKLDAEIINADAVQIYKDVSIGTAKITEEEMMGVKHHMLNIRPLSDKYTVYDYQKAGRKILNQLIKENKNIVIVGGTGLYVKALLYDYNFEEEKIKTNKYEKYSNEKLKELIDKVYEENDINLNNRKRMIRFLNHYDNTNQIIKNTPNKDVKLYDFETIYLNPKREELYSYINKRVDIMFEEGLEKEARELYNVKKNTDLIIGYRELNMYFKGEVSLEEAKELIKKNTRHYAKRQETFFKNQFKDFNYIEVDYNNFDNTINKVLNILNI